MFPFSMFPYSMLLAPTEKTAAKAEFTRLSMVATYCLGKGFHSKALHFEVIFLVNT